MFKRRTKKSSDDIRDSCGPPAATSQAQSTTYSASVDSTQPKVQSTTISTIDDFEDLDGPTEQRMVRNLTVSRSGRYKSKSKSRPSLAQSSAGPGVDGLTNRQTNLSSAAGGPGSAVVRSTATTSSAVYGGSIVATPGGPPATSYRGMATAL